MCIVANTLKDIFQPDNLFGVIFPSARNKSHDVFVKIKSKGNNLLMKFEPDLNLATEVIKNVSIIFVFRSTQIA